VINVRFPAVLTAKGSERALMYSVVNKRSKLKFCSQHPQKIKRTGDESKENHRLSDL